MSKTITINRTVILDLIKIKEKLGEIIESIEIKNNEGFNKAYRKSKKQIEKRKSGFGSLRGIGSLTKEDKLWMEGSNS